MLSFVLNSTSVYGLFYLNLIKKNILLDFYECKTNFYKRTHKYCNFRNLLSWLLGSCRLDYVDTKIFWYICVATVCCVLFYSFWYIQLVLFVYLFSEVTLMMMPCWTCALIRITRQLMIHNHCVVVSFNFFFLEHI